jgi:DNA mismatch endonuclease (patch repair protein)
MMAAIKGRDTGPECVLRSALHRLGFRFRLHRKSLPGRPDLILPKHRVAVFVNGCFWHRHAGCRYATTPRTRPEFWAAKFAANVERDRRNEAALLDAGWRLAVIWECALTKNVAGKTAEDLASWIRDGSDDRLEIGQSISDRSA